MREKYESLGLTVLRDLAKSIGVKGVSTMRKEQLVEILVAKESEQADVPKEVVKTEEKVKDTVKAEEKTEQADKPEQNMAELDSGIAAGGILRKAGYEVTTGQFMKIGVPFTLAAVCTGYVLAWILYA